MSSLPTLVDRNKSFAAGFASADLPVLPKLRTIILACIDGRVDPAHVLGLELGDAVVARNYDVQSGRVEEIAAPQTLAELRTQRDGTAAAKAT